MRSLTAHLRQTEAHDGLPFHPGCPICRQTRADRPSPERRRWSRRARRRCSPRACWRSQPARRSRRRSRPRSRTSSSEGSAPVAQSGGPTPAANPDFDPGGDTTDLPRGALSLPQSRRRPTPETTTPRPVEQEPAATSATIRSSTRRRHASRCTNAGRVAAADAVVADAGRRLGRTDVADTTPSRTECAVRSGARRTRRASAPTRDRRSGRRRARSTQRQAKPRTQARPVDGGATLDCELARAGPDGRRQRRATRRARRSPAVTVARHPAQAGRPDAHGAGGRVAVVDRDRPARTRRDHRAGRARGAPPVAAQPGADRDRRSRPADGRHDAGAAMTDQPATTLTRRDVYPGAVIDGRPARNGDRPVASRASSGCWSPRVSARRPSSSGGSARIRA